MRNVLAFCFFPAFVPASNGGQSRLFNFYQALSRWYKVTLLTSTHFGNKEEVINHGVNFIERRIPKDNYFMMSYSFLEQYSSGGDLSGPAIADIGYLPTLLHKAYLEEYEKAEIIIHDSPFTVNYDLFLGIDDKLRIYNSYNCESVLYSQLHPNIQKSNYIHDIVSNSEIKLLQHSNLVFYCNELDLQNFRKMAPNAQFERLYVPNGMTPIHNNLEKPKNNKQFHALFMGSGHPPNIQAADFIVNVLAPALPNIIFDIMGSCLKEGKYPDNVKRHGVVSEETKNHLLNIANIALNPMEAGSGSNVKVLEYFAYGLPVLSTSFGMRGITASINYQYLDANLQEFIPKLQELVDQQELLKSVGSAGKSLALDTFTWSAIVESVVGKVNSFIVNNECKEKNKFVLALNDYDSFSGIGGGGTRTRGLYEKVQEWKQVIFISFGSNDNLQIRKHESGVIIINVPKTQEHVTELISINSQFHVSTDDIVAGRHAISNPWLITIYNILRKRAQCIILEHCYLAEIPVAFNDRFIYSSQNNELQLKKRLLEWHPLNKELVNTVENLERLAVEQSATTIAVSSEDAQSLVKYKNTAGPIIVVPNGASIPKKGEEVSALRKSLSNKFGNKNVVFLGSAHLPNVEAVKQIVEQIAPKCSDIDFHILGSVCSSVLKPRSNIHLWGVVDELTKSAVMQSCDIALNPMLTGSGSNVKVADYLANGLFVISTEFGQRGYPETTHKHLKIVSLNKFPQTIYEVINNLSLHKDDCKVDRYNLFEKELSISSIATVFLNIVKNLEKKRKKVLFVTYRYTSPALGGAEVNIEKFITALGNSNDFDIDVVAPKISYMQNYWRFSENYDFDNESEALVNVPNVRFARFPIDKTSSDLINHQLIEAWLEQPHFEKNINASLHNLYNKNGLTWGWGSPEGQGEDSARWGFLECALFCKNAAQVKIDGYAAQEIVMTALSNDCIVGGPWKLNGKFSILFQCDMGEVIFVTSVEQQFIDPRPLGFRVSKILINDQFLNLGLNTLLQECLPLLSAERVFNLLHESALKTRFINGTHLTEMRGPWSNKLESYIRNHISEYDLVVTHNNIFKPAIVAIEQAKKYGIPSILIPHAHLDDDFYHFPDVLKSAQEATITLATPKIACDFLNDHGCNVKYMPAGCDVSEKFLKEDQDAFYQIYTSKRPFILILGRKAGAKGYQDIIYAVESLNKKGIDISAVLIGPDDDGIVIKSPNVVYLGHQSRRVVRGALMSCITLCNMSISESFGIVLLEAWLANKPVIANKNCAAFHDMAIHGENSLLVETPDLEIAISELIFNPDLRYKLAENGRKIVNNFDWEKVNKNFLSVCYDLVDS